MTFLTHKNCLKNAEGKENAVKLVTCHRIGRSHNCQAKGAHTFRDGSQRNAASHGKALVFLRDGLFFNVEKVKYLFLEDDMGK